MNCTTLQTAITKRPLWMLLWVLMTIVGAPLQAFSSPLRMTCTEHGEDQMTLVFVRETGAGGRSIEIVGTGSTTLWTVTVDGTTVTPGTQTKASPGQVKVQAGDKITWKVGGTKHGIVFPTQGEAEALFSFDQNQGKPLGASTDVTGYKWGTAGFRNTTLAVATVKADENKEETGIRRASIKMTCTECGQVQITLGLVLQTCLRRRHVAHR